MNDEISIDEEMVLETESAFSKDDSDIKSIVPFFKALSELRKAGALAGENKEFKRDIRFEELIMDPSFNPATLTRKNSSKLLEKIPKNLILICNGTFGSIASCSTLSLKESQVISRGLN